MAAPNRRTERDRLPEAIHQLGPDPFDVELRLIISHDQAAAEGFHGSPSFLVSGRGPFADADAPVGLASWTRPQTAWQVGGCGACWSAWWAVPVPGQFALRRKADLIRSLLIAAIAVSGIPAGHTTVHSP